MNEKPVIGLFTTFWNFDQAYSLCSVVKDQLSGLVRAGYKTVLFVLPSFNDEHLIPHGVEIRKIVPQLILEPYKDFQYPSHWKEDVAKIKDMAEKNLQDIDFLICHDIFFIDTYLPYNIGLRESNLKCKLFAWTHSAPSSRPNLTDNIHANRFTLPKKTELVYLNHDKANDLAEMYGAWLKDVKVVHNSRDVRNFWDLDSFVTELINKYDLLQADIISVYPLSTPRMISGKGLDKAIKLHSKLKKLGYKTKLIVCNAHANAEKDKKMIAQTQIWASEMDITQNDLIFTSLENSKYEIGVNSKIVSDLFRLSNIFIFPTVSEVCSLVLLEAMMSGNLLVLNKNVRSLYEFGENNALYLDFEYRNNNNEEYYLDLAKIVSSQFEISKPLQSKRKAFQKYNYDKITKDIERLFYEEDRN